MGALHHVPSDLNRLRATLDDLRQRQETALGLFLTAGYPTPEATLDILLAAAEGTEASGGADFIELGMPFSDPVAEGLPIQQASERALAAGMTMDGIFDIARSFRERSDTPLALMGYANPVLRYGVSDFCARARSSGVDALILPDLPPEEADDLDEEAARRTTSRPSTSWPPTPPPLASTSSPSGPRASSTPSRRPG